MHSHFCAALFPSMVKHMIQEQEKSFTNKTLPQRSSTLNNALDRALDGSQLSCQWREKKPWSLGVDIFNANSVCKMSLGKNRGGSDMLSRNLCCPAVHHHTRWKTHFKDLPTPSQHWSSTCGTGAAAGESCHSLPKTQKHSEQEWVTKRQVSMGKRLLVSPILILYGKP